MYFFLYAVHANNPYVYGYVFLEILLTARPSIQPIVAFTVKQHLFMRDLISQIHEFSGPREKLEASWKLNFSIIYIYNLAYSWN